MTTTVVAVTAGNQDATEQDNGGSYDATGTAMFCDSSSSNQRMGMWVFTAPGMPRFSTINEAVLASQALNATNADDPALTIHCEDIDDSPDFDVVADITGRTRTASGATWLESNQGDSGRVDSPDFKSALQIVVNRAGYTIESDVGVIFRGLTPGGQGLWRCAAYEHGSRDEGQLTVDYTAPVVGNGLILLLGSG